MNQPKTAIIAPKATIRRCVRMSKVNKADEPDKKYKPSKYTATPVAAETTMPTVPCITLPNAMPTNNVMGITSHVKSNLSLLLKSFHGHMFYFVDDSIKELAYLSIILSVVYMHKTQTSINRPSPSITNTTSI